MIEIELFQNVNFAEKSVYSRDSLPLLKMYVIRIWYHGGLSESQLQTFTYEKGQKAL